MPTPGEIVTCKGNREQNFIKQTEKRKTNEKVYC